MSDGAGALPGDPDASVAQIAAADFDGIVIFHNQLAALGAERWRALSAEHDLRLGVGTFAADADTFAREAADAARVGATWVNAQICDVEVTGAAAIELMRSFERIADGLGLTCVVETHRGTLTQDLLRMLGYVEALPRLPLAIDLSHYVVAGQLEAVNGPEADFPPTFERWFERLIEQAVCVHGRISNGNQVQVPVRDDLPAKHFARWWTKAMTSWSARADAGAGMPFVCELGPPPYAITRAQDGRQVEPADRWDDALALRDVARACWAAATATRTAGSPEGAAA
jgi:hypothetical protein